MSLAEGFGNTDLDYFLLQAEGFGDTDLDSLRGFTDWRRVKTVSMADDGSPHDFDAAPDGAVKGKVVPPDSAVKEHDAKAVNEHGGPVVKVPPTWQCRCDAGRWGPWQL